MRLIGRGLLGRIRRKSGEWSPERMLVPKPTLATSRRHISRIEQGHQVPGIRTIEGLAEHLHIHPLTLIAAAYCQDIDTASVNELLKIVKTDFRALASGQAVRSDLKDSD